MDRSLAPQSSVVKWVRWAFIIATLLAIVDFLREPSQDDRGARLDYSVDSPSGRWRAEDYTVWVQAGIQLIMWGEVRVTDTLSKGSTRVVLGYGTGGVKLHWVDESTLQLLVRGKIHIGSRVRTVGDVKVDLIFESEDVEARRDNLLVNKIPKEDWWMYDIPLD